MEKAYRMIYNIILLIISLLLRLLNLVTFSGNTMQKKPVHIIFCMVDHYEPGTGKVTKDIELKRVNDLLMKFPEFAKNHKDAFGNVPKRTWFFPPHYHRYDSLKKIVNLCSQGYGEIELHLHHGKTRPDTSENLEKTILKTIEEYSKFGIFGTCNGDKCYGFIHGDWALDNSRFNKFCGVNNEIEILKKTGCYADFTFPACEESNPLQINSIYYAKDNPLKPKSYCFGKRVKKHLQNLSDLMMIQGPIYPHRVEKNRVFLKYKINAAAIDSRFTFTKKRIDTLIKANIHVKGRKDWIFVKTHTHGAVDDNVILGKELDNALDYLEEKYNDGKNFILHYTTAREMYNIIKAIEECDIKDNPELYRDYKIKPPVYNTDINISEMSDELRKLVLSTYEY